MKVTVCFDNVRVVVPCGDGTLLVRDLMHEAILRYKKATGKNDSTLTINSLSSFTGGGLLDPDDRLCDVADDREQIVAHFVSSDVLHAGGDGASSVGTNSPDFFHPDVKEQPYSTDSHGTRSGSSIRRESTKRLSMHALSTKEPCLTMYSAQSLPRESRRREPLGQDAKASFEFGKINSEFRDHGEMREIVIKNEAGPLGLHVVPCYDLLGNDQGLRVEGIEPNGRIARDGQIDLHDKIIKINGHSLLHIPFSKVQDIFRTCMNEACLKISIVKHKKNRNEKAVQKKENSIGGGTEKVENDENVKRIQCSNYNLLQTANTRKIGRMIEIELTKGSNGLGFSVTTRDNPAGGHCPIYIKNILPKGAAVEDGRLRPGDRLLEVNNIEMTGKSQAEVVSLLRSISPGGKVRMIVSRQEEISANTSDSHCPVSSTTQSTDNTDNAKSWSTVTTSPVKKNVDTLEKPNSHTAEKSTFKSVKPSEDIVLSPRKNRMILTLDIPVHDSEKAGLGVSVKGKTTSTDENTNMDLGIFIKSVLHGGAASRDGRLRTNDQLLNINGVSLLGLSNSDAMETLRRAMLNTNSSVTGVITLTIARRISSYDISEKNVAENLQSQCKLESANSVYISDSTKANSEGRVKEKNNLNSQTDILDNGGLLSCVTASPWNPVIDRLTEQYNKNSLRNESYCIATNKTWIESVSNAKKITLGQRDDRVESVLLEESTDSAQCNEIKRNTEDKDSQYSGDPTYDSQLSLEEFTSSGNKFSRDALGRQSMSEKRHAALDAKNTDTYKRNKKLREGRENKNPETNSLKSANQSAEVTEDSVRRKVENFEKIANKVSAGESTSCDSSREPYEKSVDPVQPEYVYTIPGCNNKFTSARKHWLVDDVHGEITSSSNLKDDREGFSNTRGDVKQASLNSALDDRYKRSRKKGGIRSMLRLALQISSRSVFYQQTRNRGKVNLKRPRVPHFKKALLNEFVKPVYPRISTDLPLSVVCDKIKTVTVKSLGPYEIIIAREAADWFMKSPMVAFVHMNSMKSNKLYDFQVKLRKVNMYYKTYSRAIAMEALRQADLLHAAPLVGGKYGLVFGLEKNVEALQKVVKSTPQCILLAGILDNELLHLADFLKYGNMTDEQIYGQLVSTLQTAGGMNLTRQLIHHQSTFIQHLKAIEERGEDGTEESKDVSEKP